MSNPFEDFHPDFYQTKKPAAERIQKAQDQVVGQLVDGYLNFVIAEIENLAWMVEHEHVVSVYSQFVESIKKYNYTTYDIEAFCARWDQADVLPMMIPGPIGLYLSALINHCRTAEIYIRLKDFNCRFHFLGYRLPESKTLILEGDTGDFTGAGLYGGSLKVRGAVRNWCGAGMLAGELSVTGAAGSQVGIWMQSGTIRIARKANEIGHPRYGGRVYVKDKLVPINTTPTDGNKMEQDDK